MNFFFGDVVVVDDGNLGVVVKSWAGKEKNYDVYVRMLNGIKNYKESEMQRYGVRHKYLPEDEIEYQENAMLGL